MRNYINAVTSMYRQPKWLVAAYLVAVSCAFLKMAEDETRDEDKENTLRGARVIISAVWYVVFFRTVIRKMKANK